MVFDFGCRLKKLRKNRKMTQAQVACRLHLSKSTVSGYESNIKTPSVDVLKKLAILYDVSADFLLGLEDRESLYIHDLSESQQKILAELLSEFRTK